MSGSNSNNLKVDCCGNLTYSEYAITQSSTAIDSKSFSIKNEVYYDDHPIITKELNNDKVMLYEACGIPKENIKYETEFVNKTKQTYLIVTGHVKLKDLEFENRINIHMLIDTDIYEGYEVNINDGMVMIILHEIKNEAPTLRDFGQEKFIKTCE